MDPESKKILLETFELAKENNKLLHKVRGVQKWQAFWSILRVVIILGIALGVVYYLEPYFMKTLNIFSQFSGINQGIDSTSFQSMLKNIKP